MPEVEPLDPRPTQEDIERTAEQLDHHWIKPLGVMCQIESLSEEGLRGKGFVNWMEVELRNGLFAGWDVEDLRQLKSLLEVEQSRDSIAGL